MPTGGDQRIQLVELLWKYIRNEQLIFLEYEELFIEIYSWIKNKFW